ncbi:MAG TPA: T9SS type A sorting domain-containing protein [Paludibacter sp.]|nr:T9SS type A sorting domain-containing protein [Paludibacter sp.]
MKKITLLIVAMFASTVIFSQSTFKWNGNQTDQIWDYGTANWLDPAFPIPLPKTFSEGSSALFDDTSIEGSDTLKINGVITVNNINVNATKTYVIRSTSTTTDSIIGTGTLIKDGTGLLVMDVKNTMTGGTIIKNGKLMMEKQTTANIFGSKLVFEGGTANFATTTSGSYPSIKVPIEIKDGVTAKIEVSRYSYFASPISGNGDLEIAVGGERTMMGTNKAGGVTVDWKNFTGNVIIKQYVMSGVAPGYYGLLLPITKTWDYTNFATADSLFWNRSLTLKSGAGLTGASGTRCYGIGELQAEDDNAFLAGYGAGTSNSPRVYYMIGGKNTDVICPVTIKDAGNKGYNYLGIIKVGTGKYTFTSTKSLTTASLGVQVNQGTFLVNIPVTTTTTALGRCTAANAMTINKDAVGGGNGRLTGKVQVDSLGTLVIGYDEVGELVLGDTLTGKISSPLLVKNGGKVVFKLRSTESFDKLSSNATATFNGSTILLKPASTVSIKDGDTFTILTAKTALATDSFKLESQGFPGNVTFTSATDTIGGGLKIIVTAHGSTKLNHVKSNLVTLFPNPSNGIINISAGNAEIAAIEIINLQGQIIRSQNVNSIQAQLNIESLPKGLYYAKVYIGQDVEVKKIMLK